jgi:hypothetical protein
MMRQIWAAALILVFLVGCRSSPTDQPYVARVGENVLTQEELSLQLSALPVLDDSLEARQQIIEQWVSSQLLYREARRRGLRNDPAVQRMIEENERSVLVSALVSRMYDTEEPEFDPAELEAYYERNRERMLLREPFVNVRFLAVRDRARADNARSELAALGFEDVDEWNTLVATYAVDPEESRALADVYVAESRIFASAPQLRAALSRLSPRQTSGVIDGDTLAFVVQLLDRAPSGTIPELEWVEDEVRRRLTIEARKQMYARQVQRLRNEALAREDLEIR